LCGTGLFWYNFTFFEDMPDYGCMAKTCNVIV